MMADTTTPVPVRQTSGTEDLAQLLWQLKQYQATDEGKNAANGAARDMNGNLVDRTVATNNQADLYNKLVSALQNQINPDQAQVASDINGRTDQIFSGLAGTVDRANAIAGSQAGAALAKRGMGDSTQATDKVNDLTRNFGDVYQKLREMAAQRAFDEQKGKQTLANQAFQTATQGAVYMNSQAQGAARDNASSAAKAATTANTAYGGAVKDALSTNVAGWVGQRADAYASPILDSLKKWATGGNTVAPSASNDPISYDFNHQTTEQPVWSGSTTADQMAAKIPDTYQPPPTQSVITQAPEDFAWAKPNAPTVDTNWYTQPDPTIDNPLPEWEYQ
jgi:hypothetical protein